MFAAGMQIRVILLKETQDRMDHRFIPRVGIHAGTQPKGRSHGLLATMTG
jgi:hypothetical protein